MRIFIIGVDDQGRSCVVEERTPSGQPYESGGITVAVAAASESFAPPSRPPGRGEHLSGAGAHRLGPGDGVVINGVDHGWETHEQACRMSVVVIATPPVGGKDAWSPSTAAN